MDEQTTDTMSDAEALEADDDEAGLDDGAKKKGEGFIGKEIEF